MCLETCLKPILALPQDMFGPECLSGKQRFYHSAEGKVEGVKLPAASTCTHIHTLMHAHTYAIHMHTHTCMLLTHTAFVSGVISYK